MAKPKNCAAEAVLMAGTKYPQIKGKVLFKPFAKGVLIISDVRNLPNYQPATATTQPIGPFGYHVHQNACNPNDQTFASCGSHYNPDQQPHGNHAGDLPVLFGMNGVSYNAFYTNRFQLQDIIGRSIVIHENPDDYRTEPAGNSGARIAAGTINAKC